MKAGLIYITNSWHCANSLVVQNSILKDWNNMHQRWLANFPLTLFKCLVYLSCKFCILSCAARFGTLQTLSLKLYPFGSRGFIQSHVNLLWNSCEQLLHCHDSDVRKIPQHLHSSELLHLHYKVSTKSNNEAKSFASNLIDFNK
jgi:hypothetical protein